MATFDLIIFDCDGVLVDSEPLAMRVLLETVAECGLVMAPERAYELFLGRSLAGITAMLQKEHGVNLDAYALERMRVKLYDAFRKELRPVDGVGSVLSSLTTPLCVASSSQVERVRLALQVTGLLPFFEGRIFSATMVASGKPAPDIFLYAAGRMGAEPERCVVIEDSPAGIEAARRAGMRVLAFTGASHASSPAHRETLSRLQPDLVFDTMEDLPDHLARLAAMHKV